MIRGVSFEVSTIQNVLYKILNCIKPEKYCWYNIESQYEDWSSTEETYFLEEDYYDGESFSRQIFLEHLEHFIIFIKLQAYFENSEFQDIHTYDEFKNSDCQLLLLIYDCYYVNIYAKDESVISDLYENAIMNEFEEVKYITDSSDERTKMDVR